VVGALLSLFKDEAGIVRRSAANAIGRLGKTSVDVILALVQWLETNPEAPGAGDGVDVLRQLAIAP